MLSVAAVASAAAQGVVPGATAGRGKLEDNSRVELLGYRRGTVEAHSSENNYRKTSQCFAMFHVGQNKCVAEHETCRSYNARAFVRTEALSYRLVPWRQKYDILNRHLRRLY